MPATIKLNSARKSSHQFVLTLALFAAPLGAASAADLPVKAAAPAPAFSFTGCYVGVNLGYGGSGSDFTSRLDPGTHLVDPTDLVAAGNTGTGSGNDHGFIGGGQAGCNLQTGMYAVGLEGDLDYFKSKPAFTNPNGALATTGDPITVTQTLRTNSLATIRPRVGIVSDRILIYATGGVAFARASYTQAYLDQFNGGANTAAGLVTASRTLVGWTAGVGWEWAWTDHVSVKAEYLFAKFPTLNGLGTIIEAGNPGATNALHGSADLTIQTFRLGANYRF
jgi:outer membrane immunogenic protein